MFKKSLKLVCLILIVGAVFYMFNPFTKPNNKITDPLEADAAAFEALKNAGTNFSKEHVVDFLFIGGNGLDAVRTTLEKSGFYLAVEQNPGQLLMHKNIILELSSMQSLTAELELLAKSTNTDYDGWGATVVK